MAGVVYVTVTDNGPPDRLMSVSTPVATHADMHRSLMKNGMMEMLPVPSLPISQAAPIAFSPGAYHIMLTGLQQTLYAGETFPLKLNFAQAPSVTVAVTVMPMDAASTTGTDDTSMSGMKM